MAKRSVLVIQNAAPEITGSIGHSLTLNEIPERTVHPYSGEKVPLELGDAVGLVIMGGPIGVYDQARHSFLRDELKLIEHALGSKRPVLGVCLGSQLLAARGAEVRKRSTRKSAGIPCGFPKRRRTIPYGPVFPVNSIGTATYSRCLLVPCRSPNRS